MKTKNLFSALTLIVFAILFWASASEKTFYSSDIKYRDTQKPSENIKVSYNLPIIKPTGKTIQSQTKGGVVITAEVIPFKAVRTVKKGNQEVAYKDVNKPGFDIFETPNTPEYQITPENISFKIRIRNNEQVPLKLSDIGFAIIIDGTQWSFPTGYLDDWNKGMVLTGFEKEYIVRGPQLAGLYSAQVVYILLNGVPTSYDEAGSVTKKNNFEWYFECKSDVVQKDEQKTYTYQPKLIRTDQCAKCRGTGTDPQIYKCDYCKGVGSYVNSYDRKTYKCSTCGGTGRRQFKCPDCSGLGTISYPLSTTPPIDTQVDWLGTTVNITTIPSNAQVSIVNSKTGEYSMVGFSNIEVKPWIKASSGSKTNLYPIIIDYQGKKVKVSPYNEKGKIISKIEVDFTGKTPIITKGKMVE